MKLQEKINFVENYINNHYGEEFAEWLWKESNNFVNDKQYEYLYEMIIGRYQ